jgi:hypothetical protein
MVPKVRAVQRRQTFLSPTVVPVPVTPAASVALQPSMSSSSIGFTRIDSSGYCSDSEEPLRAKPCSSGIGTRASASCSEFSVSMRDNISLAFACLYMLVKIRGEKSLVCYH